MEEILLAVLGLAPVGLSLVGLVAAISTLKSRRKADRKFVKAVKSEAMSLGDIDPALVRHLHFIGARSVASDKDLPDYIRAALNDLEKMDRVFVSRALGQPSTHGRMRYFNRIFRHAFGRLPTVK